MGKYIKHSSNYIKTERHQFLKGGSAIFERDWVTVGGRLHFGPGKIPYYENGNFVFTTSPTPFYQKKYQNGVSVATWTYDDVEDATSTVNKVHFDEYTEDIRSFAYYGSCVELVRSSIEKIISEFPGGIVKNDTEVHMINADGSSYVLSGYYEIINDFGIDLVNEFINKEDNPIKFLKTSFNEYLLNGSSIKKYDVTEREMFMLTSDACVSNRKKESSTTIKVLSQNSHKNYWVQKQLKDWKDSQSTPPTQEEIDQKTQEFEQSYNPQTARVNYKSSRTLSLTYNDGGNVVVSGKTGSVYYQIGTNNNPDEIVYLNYDNLTDFLNTHTNVNPKFSITESNKSFDITITLDYNVNEIKVIVKNGSRTTFSATYQIDVSQYFSRTLYVNFFNEYSVIKTYCYLQNVTKEEYDQHSALYGDWVNTSCPLPNWTEYTSFQKECDEKWDFEKHDWKYVLFSQESDREENRPLYEIDIENDNNEKVKIVAYIINGKIVFMTKNTGNVVIQPKQYVIEDYFNNLEGFEKQLLTRKTVPYYSNQFITPIEHDMGYVYYKRTYTWPLSTQIPQSLNENYCIDISSSTYVDFVNKLIETAEIYDELWTDNLWKRMTHEAIKNYDWTYTRYYNEGDEEANVDGGERMHKVINIIGRVFDDIKREIDTIKQFNRVTYSGDRNIPNAFLSDKLELMGWDVYSTIPTRPDKDEYDEDEEEKFVSASNDVITYDFLSNNDLTWYNLNNAEQISFADVDINWMRRFILNSKKILSTKGTVNAIEMLMGMFGYGFMDKIKPFDIWEEYQSVRPINYDEKVYVKYDDEDVDVKIGGEMEEGYEFYNTFGDLIVSLNYSKSNERLYDDDASGITIASFMLDRQDPNKIYVKFDGSDYKSQSEYDNLSAEDKELYNINEKIDNYIIPFYEKTKWYDGDIYFQSKGGWAYMKPKGEKEDETNGFSWSETVSYLHVVSQVSDLLNVNPNSIDEGDIYYVVNVNDYFDNTETGLPLSNFFVIDNVYVPELFSSWTNLDITGSLYENDDETSESYEIDKKYRNYAAKARYLNDIIPYNIGNNPHVGYGRYDKGQEFIETMRKPFRNSFFSYDDEKIADKIIFDITEPLKAGNVGNPIYMAYKNDNTDTYILSSEYDKLNQEQQNEYSVVFKTQEEYDQLLFNEKVFFNKSSKAKIFANGYSTTSADADGGRKNLPCKEYIMDEIINLMKNKYYLNNKILHFKNNLNNEWYIDYFKKVILKYLLQIIPSTTILLLENFEYVEPNNESNTNG